jgi:phosphoglycolate phosphatase-like HAD superfamily hydrolase
VAIEIIAREVTRGRIRHALFDFDGTVSLIREGWQDIMIPMMVEVLLDTPEHEDEATLRQVVTSYVADLTGRQTIYQMLRLRQEVAKRGGEPREALAYKRAYLARLREHIRERVSGLASGAIAPDDLLLPGARAMLAELERRGVELYLASGTDAEDVVREAQLLRVDGFFPGRIFGALDRYWEFSKAKLIADIIQQHHLSGPEFLGVGDGYVEIENAKAVGGLAVGVASDEARRSGINHWKRERLIRAGADVIIPDFREHDRLIAWLWETPRAP